MRSQIFTKGSRNLKRKYVMISILVLVLIIIASVVTLGVNNYNKLYQYISKEELKTLSKVDVEKSYQVLLQNGYKEVPFGNETRIAKFSNEGSGKNSYIIILNAQSKAPSDCKKYGSIYGSLKNYKALSPNSEIFYNTSLFLQFGDTQFDFFQATNEKDKDDISEEIRKIIKLLSKAG